MSILKVEKEGNVAVVTLNDPDEKVNKLNEKLIDQVTDFLDELRSDNSLRGAIIISGKENNFIAGADLDMLKARATAEELEEMSCVGQEVLLEIENFPKPIVACIHGSCMGGGTELALACHYRIISDSNETKIALSEVKLGLIPGMGGTQRLPRLIGIQKSLPYLLTGKNMYSRQAAITGFADEVVNRNKLKQAGIRAVQKYANRKVERKDRRGFFERILENNGLGRLIIFSQAHKKTAAQTRGNYPAPPQIIESVRYGFKEGLKSGLRNESKIFGQMGVTPESKALVQLFFEMNKTKKNPGKEKAKQIKNIGVLGAGLMGSGIAQVSIENGYHVWLKDQKLERATGGKKTIYENLQKDVDKKIITPFERDEKLSLIHPTETYESFKTMDLVIEAVFEDLDLKRKIVTEVEAATNDQCIFASNTSSLPIKDIAANANRPENIIGMHYFSPVQKMPLLEIIKTDRTPDWVTATAYEAGLKQGKTIIVVNDGPGFYTTRIIAPFMNEALLLLEEGADIAQIDRAMKDFGFPVGPFANLDEVGIDVGAHVAGVLSDIFKARGGKTSQKATELVNAGYKGRKNQKGFYRYNGKKKEVNTDIYQFFGGQDRDRMDDEDIQFRIAMMMINEAVYCLQEGILMSPTDGDIGAIFGLGFPPFLGGPFRYIDREGADEILDFMQELENDYGRRFAPADLLQEYARQNKTFHSE